MKKALSLLLALFVTAAAASAEHLKFKGIDIDGDINSFTNKLAEIDIKPLPIDSPNKHEKTYYGLFAGKDCVITARVNPKTKKVYQVVASVPMSNAREGAERLLFYNSTIRKNHEVVREESEKATETFFYTPQGCISTLIDKSLNSFNVYIFYTDSDNLPAVYHPENDI